MKKKPYGPWKEYPSGKLIIPTAQERAAHKAIDEEMRSREFFSTGGMDQSDLDYEPPRPSWFQRFKEWIVR